CCGFEDMYLYPSDFEDLYLLNLQGHLNHLPPKDKKILTTAVNQWTRHLVIRQRVEDFQLRIESYQTQLNLTKPQWDATGFEYKHDYTVIDSPRAQIDEALDYRVKELRINRMNPEAAKLVGDFKYLVKEADESLAKHKAMELEIECLLRAVIERFQAQLGDLKGKSKDTSCVSDTLNPVSQKLENENVELEFQKLENENVELEFQVLNYARENAHLKASYKNLFDSMSVSRAQSKTIIASLQNELQSNIYKNAKLRTQLFKKAFDQKDNTQTSSENNKFVKQPIVENLPKIGKTNALSKPITSNSVSSPQEPKGVNNDKVIAPGMFRINPSTTSREKKNIPNTVSASARTNPITVSLPHVITKKDVNSDLHGLSSTGVDNTKTRRPQRRSNTKHDKVPSASKTTRSKNKATEVEEHHRNLLFSKNNKHISSACNNSKIDSQDVISKVVCAMCKKCLISVNHDKCLRNYVNGKNSLGKKQTAKVFVKEIQKKYLPKIENPHKVGTRESLATPKPRKSRLLLRWSPTGKLFDPEGKIVDSSKSKSTSDCSNGDNACTSNTTEPKIKRFPNSTSLLGSLWELSASKMIMLLQFWDFLGFVDLQWGNIQITRVYFVEGLGHNLFSVGQFCDSDLEVPFRRDACFVRNLEGVDLLKGDRSTNLYAINLHEMASASPICLMARASSTKSWLWHQRLSHLNFDTINDLARNELVAVERRNRTLVEAARTMLIFSRAPLFLWVEAIATACFTQNRFIIHQRFNKTPYELINGRKPDISYIHVFGALCYPKNDREDIGKLGAKGDIGFFIGYSTDSCAYRVYNQRTKKIMETMNVSFDKLSAMAFEQRSSKPRLQSMTSGQISSGLDLTYAPSTITTQQPTEEPQVRQSSTASTTIADTDPIPTNSSSLATNIPIPSQDVDELNPNAMVNGNTFVNPFANSSTSAAVASSSLQNVDPSNMHTFYQPYPHKFHWTKDHPLEQVIGEPSRLVLTRNQLRSDGDMCMYALTFKRLDVWVLVLAPDNISPLTLKWLFKNKHDEEQTVIRNKSRLVVRGYRQEEGIDFEESFAPPLRNVDVGEMTFFLGLQVNQSPCGIFINQSKYVLEILNKYGMESCDPVGTPMEIKDKLELDQNGTPVDATKYRRMIGALMYLMSSRPDIDSGFELTVFSDADYAECKDTFKSTFGGAQFLGEKLVSWSSKKQDCTALSTAEAEYVSLSACCAKVLWMQTQLTDYGFHFNKILIYCDSKSAIAISCNPTDYQLADIFTKALPTDRFNYLVRRLAGLENRPHMLNKENHVPRSSRLLRYAKSRPNGKLIHNSIINSPYVRRMIPEPSDPNHEVPVNETFHVQTDDELTEKELKQIEADDQAIQTILLGLPKDIYAVVDSCETAQEIWLRVPQMMKGSDIRIQEKKAKLFNEREMFTSTDEESIESQTKDLHTTDYTLLYDFLKYNQKENVGNQNGQIVIPGTNQNPNGNGNLIAARAEGNAPGHNGIQLQAKEFDLMAAAADLDEIKEVNADCILMANLQQASTSGTQTDKAPEEQYTELLKPILETHQVPQNDINVISEVTSVEQSGGTVEQHPANVEETRFSN
nr:copia protein [Tanacetum cinerariifolium]